EFKQPEFQRPRPVNTARPNPAVVNVVRLNQGYPQHVQEDQGYVDSGCSRHMTGNISYLSYFKKFNRGYVTFGRGANGGRITGKKLVLLVVSISTARLSKAIWIDLQTTAANTLDTGEVQITATIDRKVKLVSEESIMRHLKLEDSDGISTLPNTEIFKQLALIGIPTRQETKVSQPSSPTHTHVADEAASIGVDVKHGGAATTVSSLDAGQGSGNINKTPSMPHDSPLPRVNTLGSDEGTRRKAKIVASDDEEEFEDPSKQGMSMIEEIDQDTKVTLVTPTQVSTQGEAHSQPKDQVGVLSVAKVLADATKVHTYTRRRRRAVNTGSDGVSTASRMISIAEESFSIVGASMPVSTSGMIDKGKGIMEESELVQTKTKRQQEQERINLETAVRLQEQLDEKERQRINRVHEEASSFNIAE
nr:hypothetical protein [Tanacetum cinerariifolium]